MTYDEEDEEFSVDGALCSEGRFDLTFDDDFRLTGRENSR